MVGDFGMRIEPRALDKGRDERLKAELLSFMNPTPSSYKVCGERCGNSAASVCSMSCPDFRDSMSTDPKEGIEEAIAPMVFELARLSPLDPCWSCEGHLDPMGELWKTPKVWFYCDSIVAIRVLTASIQDLFLVRKLSAQWQIAAVYTGETGLDPMFSIQPCIQEGDGDTLRRLRKDSALISTHVNDLFRRHAGQFKASLR